MTSLTAIRPLSPSFPDTANSDGRAHSSSAGSPTSVLNAAESASSAPVEPPRRLHRRVDNVLQSPRNSSSKNKWSSLDPQDSLFSFTSPTKTKPSTPRKPLSLSMKPPTPLAPIDGHVLCSPRRTPQLNGRKHLASRPPPPPASSPFAASPRRTPATARKLSCARPLPPPVSQYSSSPTKDSPPPLIQKARSPPPPPPMTETPSDETPTAHRKTATKVCVGLESPVAAVKKASPLPYGSSPVKACRPKVPKFTLSKKPVDKKIKKESQKSSAARHGPKRTKSNESDPEGGHGAIYSGPHNERGERHGEGQLVWENGDIYQGNFVNNVREGQGTLTYAATQKNNDNGEYVGEWHNNRMHGEGTRRYPNGGLYIGEYEYGKKEGEGRFYYTNGDLFWGSWHANKMNGPGRYYYSSGKRFEGFFVNNMRSGKGKLQRADDSLEVFLYVKDQRVGDGIHWSPDRSKAWRVSRTGVGGGEVSEVLISVEETVKLVTEIEFAASTNKLT